jgi:hypothetical protein
LHIRMKTIFWFFNTNNSILFQIHQLRLECVIAVGTHNFEKNMAVG